MKEYRISKYNPKFREDGKYLINDWTSFYDIGSVFNGKLFTIQDYEAVEYDYIKIVIDLMDRINVDSLRISAFENYQELDWKDGQVLQKDQIKLFIVDILRERCWGKLENEKFFVHFGYDLYIYVGLNLELREIEEIALNTNLFVERMNSPYHI